MAIPTAIKNQVIDDAISCMAHDGKDAVTCIKETAKNYQLDKESAKELVDLLAERSED